MALIKSAVKLISFENKTYHFNGPCLNLGVPEIYANFKELEKWLNFSPEKSRGITPEETNNIIGKKYHWVSAKTFYSMLGIKDIFSIDIPGCEHKPDLVHDLNNSLPVEMENKYNLIMDPGTLEHVFDTKACLENIVKSLKIGGVVIHQVPIYSYNGGYYNFNPNVLIDFYSANGFKEIKAYIIMWDRYNPFTGKSRCYLYSEDILGARHALADFDQCRNTPHLLLFARKFENLNKTVIPIQKELPHRIQGSSLVTSAFFRRLYSALPPFITQRIWRILTFIMIRKKSFRA
jgi:hypothetical protein